MHLQTIAIFILTLAGFALRLHYLTTTHPFFDEYTTVLAARQILEHGWPMLPSGLFYEHGLLATYLIAPFTALFVYTPIAQWQPAQWGLMLARWPSVLIGTLTIPLIYMIGRRINCQLSMVNGQSHRKAAHSSTSNPSTFNLQPSNLPSSAALLAAGIFALSPEGMVWGGRARMYTLATLLVLLTVYWGYRGAISPAPTHYRGWAMLALLAVLLTQFGAMILIPPLVVAMIVVGWLSHQKTVTGGAEQSVKSNNYTSRFTFHIPRVWFLRRNVVLEILVLTVVVGCAVLVKRLGQPLGAAALGSEESGALPAELLGTVTYQTALHFTWTDTIDFLAEQFGPAHHFWLAMATVAAGSIGLILWLIRHRRTNLSASSPPHFPVASPSCLIPSFNLFLWLVFGLIILEMVAFLDPFRRNPRYLVMYLPLFYLIAASTIMFTIYDLRFTIYDIVPFGYLRFTHHVLRFISPALISLGLLLMFTIIGFADLRIALVTPEPAYEQAFEFIQTNWQPGDVLFTMNTPAAGLYRGQVDGFTVQDEADQFLLQQDTGRVDRWLGVPWVGNAADFNAALNAHERTWFVIDTIRLPVYFHGDWLAVVNTQMQQVWAKDNALIYHTRPDRIPLPTQPTTSVEAILGDSIQLVGYTLQISGSPSLAVNSSPQSPREAPNLYLTLFWQSLRPITTDYTVFLHLRRTADGVTVAQKDGLSLSGAYPTSRWQLDETVIDPITLSLPPDLPSGRYTLWVGMYQLETLQRLPIANDTSGENAVFLGEVMLP